LKERDLLEPATILIGVGDGVLADSLRFALELEGFRVRLCDEYSLSRELLEGATNVCLVLDQGVFARLDAGGWPFVEGIPVVLIVGHQNARVTARAKAAGVAKVVEAPLVGGVLFEAIRSVLDASYSRSPQRPA
jgi:FixJ family two-component response regulator